MDRTALSHRRITIFAGHYGSGKTNAAVNYALMLKKLYRDVSVADLDIVNPYFRTKDAAEVMSANGIRLISSELAGTNVDTPALPSDTYSIIHDKSIHAVIDVGGDDRGALALGRYAPDIVAENNYDMLLVVNKYRYLTRDVESLLEVMSEIEQCGGIKFNGIVNNSNIGIETEISHVVSGLEFTNEVATATGLEVKFTSVKSDLLEKTLEFTDKVLPMELYVRQSWQK